MVGYSPALINMRTIVAKRVNTRFLRSFCGRYLVDKVLYGRYLVDFLGFFWWSIFDKTPVAGLHMELWFVLSPTVIPGCRRYANRAPVGQRISQSHTDAPWCWIVGLFFDQLVPLITGYLFNW